jgi:hypothetical protein
MLRKVAILNFIFVLLFPSCEREDSNFCHQMGRDSGDLPVQSIGEISNDSINLWLTITDTVFHYNPIFYRIDNQDDFNDLVKSNLDDVEFNFHDYTLLMGYFFKSVKPDFTIDQSVHLHCGWTKQSIGYEVIVNAQKVYDNFIPIQYHVIVQKLPEGIGIGNRVYINELDTVSN